MSSETLKPALGPRGSILSGHGHRSTENLQPIWVRGRLDVRPRWRAYKKRSTCLLTYNSYELTHNKPSTCNHQLEAVSLRVSQAVLVAPWLSGALGIHVPMTREVCVDPPSGELRSSV